MKPGNLITSHLETQSWSSFHFGLKIYVVVSTRASFIWDATVLSQISLYNLSSFHSSPTVSGVLSMYAGLIASCASCAFACLVLNFLPSASEYSLPNASSIYFLLDCIARSDRLTLSVLIYVMNQFWYNI